MLGLGLSIPIEKTFTGTLTGGISFANGYPMDSVPGLAIAGAYGVGALASSWKTGALFDLVVSGVTTTIHATGLGYPDVKAILNALGPLPFPGIGGGTISKLYDQSGNGRDFVQATTGPSQPSLWYINGSIYLAFSGALARTVGIQPSFMTNSAVVANQAFGVFASITDYTATTGASVSDTRYSCPWATAQTIGAPNLFLADMYAGGAGGAPPATGVLAVAADVPHGISTTLANLQISNNPAIASMTGSPSAVTLGFNGSAATGAAFSAEASLITVLGTDGAGFAYFGGRMTGIIVAGATPSGAQTTTLTNSVAAWSGVVLAPTKTNNIAWDAASTTENQGADPLNKYPTQSGGGYGVAEIMKDRFGSAINSWRNIAISGSSINDCADRFTSGFSGSATYDSSYTRNILIVGGESAVDIIQLGGTGTDAYNDFVTYLAAARAGGRTWNIATWLYDPSLGGADAAQFLVFNNLMRANAVANNVTLLDMTGDTRLAAPPYINADGHPTVLGSQVLAIYVAPFLQQFM